MKPTEEDQKRIEQLLAPLFMSLPGDRLSTDFDLQKLTEVMARGLSDQRERIAKGVEGYAKLGILPGLARAIREGKV